MLKQTLLTILMSLLMALSVTAQDNPDQSSPCTTPFVTQTQLDDLNANRSQDQPLVQPVMVVDETIATDTLFAQRIRFEHAYNAIQYTLRRTNLEATAAETGQSLDDLIASDTQLQRITQETNIPPLLAQRVLSELAEDAIVWAYAHANDLTLTETDLQNTRMTFFALENTPQEDAAAIINTFYQQAQNNGADAAEIDAFFCRQTRYNQVRDQLFGTTETATFVNADHILVNSELVAQDILTLIEEGSTFEELASDLSLDAASATNGGALGWQPIIFYVEPFADALFEAEVGTLFGPVETQFGWHIIRLNAREERPVTGDERQRILSTRFSRWRSTALENATIAIEENWQMFIPTLPPIAIDNNQP